MLLIFSRSFSHDQQKIVPTITFPCKVWRAFDLFRMVQLGDGATFLDLRFL
jgi:hypothetical protein